MDEVLHESVLSEFSLEVSFGTNILFVFLLKDKVWCTKKPHMVSGCSDYCQTSCCQQIFSSST